MELRKLTETETETISSPYLSEEVVLKKRTPFHAQWEIFKIRAWRFLTHHPACSEYKNHYFSIGPLNLCIGCFSIYSAILSYLVLFLTVPSVFRFNPYVMSILPDYYEHLISETLDLYDKRGVSPKIRLIRLIHENKKVIYLEEFILENSIFKSYGVILVQQNPGTEEIHNLSYYRKILRNILDRKKNLRDVIKIINPYFEDVRWGAILDEELNQIAEVLDNNDDFEMEV